MTREKALEVMDALTAKGYPATITAAPVPAQYLNPSADNGVMYRVGASALSFNRIDFRALVEIADELDLGVGMDRLGPGEINFYEEDKTPAAVRSPRQHPR